MQKLHRELLVVDTTDHDIVIKRIGRMNLESTNAIHGKFTVKTAARRIHSIIDMSQVSVLASLGMRTLLASAKTLKQHNASMVLVNPQLMVKEVLEMAGIAQVMPIADSFDEANAQVQS